MHWYLRSASSIAIVALALCGAAAEAQVDAPAPAPAGPQPQSATAAPAQTATTPVPAATPSDASQPDIIVTASKRAENLRDVPMSITAITGASLQDKGINNVQDLVKITPGLSYVESGLGTPVFSLRGVGFFDTSLGARPTVSVYVDEAPLPFSIMAQGAAFDLERVEVLKGPQGTLFGQNSTGGAINYIAAKPKDAFGAGVTASYARFNTADIQAYVTGPIAPTLDFRLAVRGVRSSGWQESETRYDHLGRQNFTQGRLLLDWTPSDRLKVSVNVNGFIDRSDTQAAQLIGLLYVTPRLAGNVPLLAAAPLARSNDRVADWDAGTDFRKNTRFYQGVVRGDYDVTDDITLTSITAYSHITVNQTNDVDGTAVYSSNSQIVGGVHSFSEELRLAGKLGGLRWIVGGSYARDKSTENDYLTFPYASANYSFTPLYRLDYTNPFTKQSFHTKAVFGNLDFDFGKFTAHGGVRYTAADLSFEACNKIQSASSAAAVNVLFTGLRAARGLAPNPVAAGQCYSLDANLNPNIRAQSFNQHNVSWRVGLDYKPQRDVLLYANVSRGYKAGSVALPGAINLEEFDPVNQESLLAYEVGFKLSFANRKVDVSGAAFYYDYTDKQLLGRRITTPNLLGALPALINVPKSWVKGAEGQISAYPVRGLTLTAAATYLDTKVTSDFLNYTILATQQNFQGNGFPYTPKWQVVLDGQYKFPLTPGLTGVVGSNFNYRSKTTAGFGDSPYLRINAYTLVDARIGVEDPDGKWSAQLFGRNIFNTYYWTNVAKYNDTVRRYAGLPATYGVQVSYKF